MKLARYKTDADWRIGAVEGEEIADLAAADGRLQGATIDAIAIDPDLRAAAARAAEKAPRVPLAVVRLGPPVTPRKFLGLGLCYASHAREMERRGMIIPEYQNWFNKQVTALNGPYDAVHLPRVSTQLDYEGELAMVIGRRARHVPASEAMSIVSGFMICNDFSVRDWQRRAPTATLGKSFDTHGPVGPWLTTRDAMPDPTGLSIRTWVDGELRQDGNTREMIWSFGQMIEELSSVFTLEPGDIIATGTPAGVGQGMEPPRFLTEGQRVRVEIEGLGHIENRVVAEP